MVKLFDKLRKSFTSAVNRGDDSPTENKLDLRVHPRYSLTNLGLFHLLDPDSAPIPIQDISYGGIAIANADRPAYWAQTLAVETEMKSVLGRCRVSLMPIHKSNTHMGYAFIHNDIKCLEFLRPIMEDLRLGYTLQPIAEKWRKEEYQGKNWHLLRGDGPVDLLFKTSSHDLKIVDFMMTIRQHQNYHELRYENQRWRTLESTEEPGVAVRMHETPSLNASTVERCVYILAGANSRFANPALSHVISTLMAKLLQNAGNLSA